ncbi:MAG: isoprenylcysteine carboxylmethyltransferase family protein [Verrucomicrobia bacterium]|nr:isoprenylcysteine carboxylmethyltransferase family protein [Verrucomicrobiota bacterium]
MSNGSDWAFRYRVFLGVAFLTPCVVVAVFSKPLFTEGSWADVVTEFFGWAVFLLGAGCRLWATLYIGGRKKQVLVTEGPYSICRNPLYVGSFLIGMSAGFFLQSIVFMAGFFLVVVAYATAVVPREESRLREIFGEEYARFCQSVPRFWPHPRGFHTAPTIELNLKNLSSELKSSAIWIGLPVLAKVFNMLRCQPWWPHFF